MPSDKEHLKRRLCQLLKDPATREEAQEAARRTIEDVAKARRRAMQIGERAETESLSRMVKLLTNVVSGLQERIRGLDRDVIELKSSRNRNCPGGICPLQPIGPSVPFDQPQPTIFKGPTCGTGKKPDYIDHYIPK
jgi:hypothetical protein